MYCYEDFYVTLFRPSQLLVYFFHPINGQWLSMVATNATFQPGQIHLLYFTFHLSMFVLCAHQTSKHLCLLMAVEGRYINTWIQYNTIQSAVYSCTTNQWSSFRVESWLCAHQTSKCPLVHFPDSGRYLLESVYLSLFVWFYLLQPTS